MTPVERVVDVLGGHAVLKRSVRTWRELEEVVNGGLPKRALQVIQVPPGVAVERLDPSTLKGWDADDKAVSQAFGDRWYDERRSAVLLVPSLAAPGLEWNVAINQQHPGFSRLSASTLRAVVAHPRRLA